MSEMWNHTHFTLSSVTYFFINYIWEENCFEKKKKQLRRHSPEFNGAELSKRPNRNLRVDPRNYSTLSMGSIISFFPFKVLSQYFGKKLTVSTVM